jgi:cation transport protein ChaC
VPMMSDDELLQVLRGATGRYGTTLQYLLDTARCLHERGVRDREIERLMSLVRRHKLG